MIFNSDCCNFISWYTVLRTTNRGMKESLVHDIWIRLIFRVYPPHSRSSIADIHSDWDSAEFPANEFTYWLALVLMINDGAWNWEIQSDSQKTINIRAIWRRFPSKWTTPLIAAHNLLSPHEKELNITFTSADLQSVNQGKGINFSANNE